MSAAGDSPNGSVGAGRSSRLPRWTRQEILALVEAKKSVETRSNWPTGRPVGPKWAAVSAHCRGLGVERGPLQCRKRWSNLACDFKKVRSWEEEGEGGYWEMRSDLRRERRLPGFFDREVYELMGGGEVEREEEEEVVFDSGRAAREEGLFSEDSEDEREVVTVAVATVADELVTVMPLSERKSQPPENEHSEPGNSNDKQQTDNMNPEKGSSSWEGQKRQRRTSSEEGIDSSKLIEVLERNCGVFSAQFGAHNLNCQLDREQRKDQAEGLLTILTKLADSLGRIADKL